MNIRLISGGIFLALYLGFLSWYDGWGNSPLSAEEVETYLANVGPEAEGVEFVDRLRKLGAQDDGEEIFMLNLNRYRYAEGEPEEGVPVAYQDYSVRVIRMVLANAGHPIYSGQFPIQLMIGDSEQEYWDDIILVRYRSRREFLSMVTSDAYQAIAGYRADGIEYAEVTPTSATINLATPRLVVLVILGVFAALVDLLLKGRRKP